MRQIEPTIIELATICQRGEEYTHFMVARAAAATATVSAADGISADGDAAVAAEVENAIRTGGALGGYLRLPARPVACWTLHYLPVHAVSLAVLVQRAAGL